MLELRPNCECCDRDLVPASRDAWICTFECTWCTECADALPDRRCPNCGGTLERRPVRPEHLLATRPPSTQRIHSPEVAARHGHPPA